MDLVHFKFTHGGSWHRFVLRTRGSKLFPRLKKRVNFVLGVEEQQLWWYDGETVNRLDDAVDLQAAIAYAEHEAALYSCVPCVYIRLEETQTWETEQEQVKEQEQVAEEAPVQREGESIEQCIDRLATLTDETLASTRVLTSSIEAVKRENNSQMDYVKEQIQRVDVGLAEKERIIARLSKKDQKEMLKKAAKKAFIGGREEGRSAEQAIKNQLKEATVQWLQEQMQIKGLPAADDLSPEEKRLMHLGYLAYEDEPTAVVVVPQQPTSTIAPSVSTLQSSQSSLLTTACVPMAPTAARAPSGPFTFTCVPASAPPQAPTATKAPTGLPTIQTLPAPTIIDMSETPPGTEDLIASIRGLGSSDDDIRRFAVSEFARIGQGWGANQSADSSYISSVVAQVADSRAALGNFGINPESSRPAVPVLIPAMSGDFPANPAPSGKLLPNVTVRYHQPVREPHFPVVVRMSGAPEPQEQPRPDFGINPQPEPTLSMLLPSIPGISQKQPRPEISATIAPSASKILDIKKDEKKEEQREFRFPNAIVHPTAGFLFSSVPMQQPLLPKRSKAATIEEEAEPAAPAAAAAAPSSFYWSEVHENDEEVPATWLQEAMVAERKAQAGAAAPSLLDDEVARAYQAVRLGWEQRAAAVAEAAKTCPRAAKEMAAKQGRHVDDEEAEREIRDACAELAKAGRKLEARRAAAAQPDSVDAVFDSLEEYATDLFGRHGLDTDEPRVAPSASDRLKAEAVASIMAPTLAQLTVGPPTIDSYGNPLTLDSMMTATAAASADYYGANSVEAANTAAFVADYRQAMAEGRIPGYSSGERPHEQPIVDRQANGRITDPDYIEYPQMRAFLNRCHILPNGKTVVFPGAPPQGIEVPEVVMRKKNTEHPINRRDEYVEAMKELLSSEDAAAAPAELNGADSQHTTSSRLDYAAVPEFALLPQELHREAEQTVVVPSGPGDPYTEGVKAMLAQAARMGLPPTAAIAPRPVFDSKSLHEFLKNQRPITTSSCMQPLQQAATDAAAPAATPPRPAHPTPTTMQAYLQQKERITTGTYMQQLQQADNPTYIAAVSIATPSAATATAEIITTERMMLCAAAEPAAPAAAAVAAAAAVPAARKPCEWTMEEKRAELARKKAKLAEMRLEKKRHEEEKRREEEKKRMEEEEERLRRAPFDAWSEEVRRRDEEERRREEEENVRMVEVYEQREAESRRRLEERRQLLEEAYREQEYLAKKMEEEEKKKMEEELKWEEKKKRAEEEEREKQMQRKLRFLDREIAKDNKEHLLSAIRSLFNEVTPDNKAALTKEFLDLRVHESPYLDEIVSIIYSKAVEEPIYCDLYASMCREQEQAEVKTNTENLSKFRNAILIRAQETFSARASNELLESQSQWRRRKRGNILFIGHMYMHGLVNIRIVHFCVVDLLQSINGKPENLKRCEIDEESVECAVRLLMTTGARLEAESCELQQQEKSVQQLQPFPMDLTFRTLEAALPLASDRLGNVIMKLVELRENGWVASGGDKVQTRAATQQVDRTLCSYDRESFHNVREEDSTPCPLTPAELLSLGVSRSLAKSVRLLNEQIAADEREETKKENLLKSIRALLNKVTPSTKDQLMDAFLKHKVYESPYLNEIVALIFDKCVADPQFGALYAAVCGAQVRSELETSTDNSKFRNAILVRAQETFTTRDFDDVKVKEAAMELITEEKKKNEMRFEITEMTCKFRRRKFGNIMFLGHMYLEGLIGQRIILFCVVDLLKTVTEKPHNLKGYEIDEESIDCLIRLLETIGKRLEEESNATKTQQPFPMDMTFKTLEGAMPIVSNRLKFMIMTLVGLRNRGWVPRPDATKPSDSSINEVRITAEDVYPRKARVSFLHPELNCNTAEQKRAQVSNIGKRVLFAVLDFVTRDSSLEEVCDEVFRIVNNDSFSNPSLQLVFKCFMIAAVEKGASMGVTSSFGHVLAACMRAEVDKEQEIAKGIADFCREAVREQRWIGEPKLWDIVAEVFLAAHEKLYEGSRPSLADFQDAFIAAAKDSRSPTLFVLFLEKLVAKNYKRDKFEDILNDIISYIFAQSVEQPELNQFLAYMCSAQIARERKNEMGTFRNAILLRAQNFSTGAQEVALQVKRDGVWQAATLSEKCTMIDDIPVTKERCKKSKFGNIMFIGHLYLRSIISSRIVMQCAADLLGTAAPILDGRGEVLGHSPLLDSDSVECAVALLTLCGKALEEESTVLTSDGDRRFVSAKSLDALFANLDAAARVVNERVRSQIEQLMVLRANGWSLWPSEPASQTMTDCLEHYPTREDHELVKQAAQRGCAWRKPEVKVENYAKCNPFPNRQPRDDMDEDPEEWRKLQSLVRENEEMMRVVNNFLINITVEKREMITSAFLNCKVHEYSNLDEVVSLIFEKALEHPSKCLLYASLCAAQIAKEITDSGDSKFLQAIYDRFCNVLRMNKDERIQELERAILNETDTYFKNLKKSELIDAKCALNKRKYSNIRFLADIFVLNLDVELARLLQTCLQNLLHTAFASVNGEIVEMDWDSYRCAVEILERTGKLLDQAESKDAASFDSIFDVLRATAPSTSTALGNQVARLLATRYCDWVPPPTRAEIFLEKVTAFFETTVSTTMEEISAFLMEMKMHEISDASLLEEIISAIFDKAADQPELAQQFAMLCADQVAKDTTLPSEGPSIRDIVLNTAHAALNTMFDATESDKLVAEKEIELSLEVEEDKKTALLVALIDLKCCLRKRKLGRVDVFAHLFLLDLVPASLLQTAVSELIRTILKGKNGENGLTLWSATNFYGEDEETIECILRLLFQCGAKLHDAIVKAVLDHGAAPFLMHEIFDVLENAKPKLSEKLRVMIDQLTTLRSKGWVTSPDVTARQGLNRDEEEARWNQFEKEYYANWYSGTESEEDEDEVDDEEDEGEEEENEDDEENEETEDEEDDEEDEGIEEEQHIDGEEDGGDDADSDKDDNEKKDEEGKKEVKETVHCGFRLPYSPEKSDNAEKEVDDEVEKAVDALELEDDTYLPSNRGKNEHVELVQHFRTNPLMSAPMGGLINPMASIMDTISFPSNIMQRMCAMHPQMQRMYEASALQPDPSDAAAKAEEEDHEVYDNSLLQPLPSSLGDHWSAHLEHDEPKLQQPQQLQPESFLQQLPAADAAASRDLQQLQLQLLERQLELTQQSSNAIASATDVGQGEKEATSRPTYDYSDLMEQMLFSNARPSDIYSAAAPSVGGPKYSFGFSSIKPDKQLEEATQSECSSSAVTMASTAAPPPVGPPKYSLDFTPIVDRELLEQIAIVENEERRKREERETRRPKQRLGFTPMNPADALAAVAPFDAFMAASKICDVPLGGMKEDANAVEAPAARGSLSNAEGAVLQAKMALLVLGQGLKNKNRPEPCCGEQPKEAQKSPESYKSEEGAGPEAFHLDDEGRNDALVGYLRGSASKDPMMAELMNDDDQERGAMMDLSPTISPRTERFQTIATLRRMPLEQVEQLPLSAFGFEDDDDEQSEDEDGDNHEPADDMTPPDFEGVNVEAPNLARQPYSDEESSSSATSESDTSTSSSSSSWSKVETVKSEEGSDFSTMDSD